MVASTPPPVRASDAERERAIRELRDRSVEGRISFDTFMRRLDSAFQARSREELASLLDDLPPHGRVAGHLTGAAAAVSGVMVRLKAAWRQPQQPRLPHLALPEVGRDRLTIGRASVCDLVLDDLTVSRFHAELWQRDGKWLLLDLGSTNGTRVNGWRVTGPAPIRPGDHVSFGAVRLRVTAR